MKNIYIKISKTPINCEDKMDSFTGIFQGFHCLISRFLLKIRLKKYNKSIRKDMHERHWDRDGDARKKENQKTLNSVFG